MDRLLVSISKQDKHYCKKKDEPTNHFLDLAISFSSDIQIYS
jgi:hypothetical protein